MKRDKGLIYQILKWTEENATGTLEPAPDLRGYSPELIRYHIGLCEQAGYLEPALTSTATFIRNLTWHGHNVLEKLQESCSLQEADPNCR